MNAVLAVALVAAWSAIGAAVGVWTLVVLRRRRTVAACANGRLAACGVVVERGGESLDRRAPETGAGRLDFATDVISRGLIEQSARHLFRPRFGVARLSAARTRDARGESWPGTIPHELFHWTPDRFDSRRRGNLGVFVGSR